MNQIFLLKSGLVVIQSQPQCRHFSANARPHQLYLGDEEMGTAIPCERGSQVATLYSFLLAEKNKQTNKHSLLQMIIINARFIGKLHTKVIGDWLVLYES